MFRKVKIWILGLVSLLLDQSGEDDLTVVVDDPIVEESEESEESEEESEESKEEEETNEEGNEEGEEKEVENEDEEDLGKNANRSKTIPRKRLDKALNKLKEKDSKIAKYERLKEMGILVEGDDGEIHLNPEVAKNRKDEEGGKKPAGSIRLNLAEVAEDSQPIAKTINEALDQAEANSGKGLTMIAYETVTLRAEIAAMRDFPEYLSKNSPLRKKAFEVLKETEFKRKYKGDPEKMYHAVKRASEILKGKKPSIPKKPKKKSFIIGKGDSGGSGTKTIKLGDLTDEQLDDLEKKEHEKRYGKK